MNITLTDMKGRDIYILPHVPSDIENSTEPDNETKDTMSGKLRIVGEDGLRHISWSGVLPVYKSYSWQKVGSRPNGYDYIKFIEGLKRNNLPMRVVITDSSLRSLVNMLMSIDSFSYKKDKAKDFTYSISLTEFPSEKWDLLNSWLVNKTYYSELIGKSLAKKALQKFGLL